MIAALPITVTPLSVFIRRLLSLLPIGIWSRIDDDLSAHKMRTSK